MSASPDLVFKCHVYNIVYGHKMIQKMEVFVYKYTQMNQAKLCRQTKCFSLAILVDNSRGDVEYLVK